MSETPNTSELLLPLQGKILLPEEFDRRLNTEQKFRDRVAGITTVSLNHIMRGLSPYSFEVPTYGVTEQYINCDLSQDVYENIFNIQPDLPESLPELISTNRESGVLWGA